MMNNIMKLIHFFIKSNMPVILTPLLIQPLLPKITRITASIKNGTLYTDELLLK